MSWYVYAIGTRDAGDWDQVKIGRGDPAKRLRTAQVWRAERLHVLAKQRTRDAKRFEERIHWGLRASRVRGEVFRRSHEVERFLRVFRRSLNREFEIYVARLLGDDRCACGAAIELEAPIWLPRWQYPAGVRNTRCADCEK